MSSQQDAQRPNTVDTPLPRAPEAKTLTPSMEGAGSRSHTSKDIKTRLNELWGEEGWIPPFPHKLTGQHLTVDSFSYRDLHALLSVSNKAASRGIALASLYEPRGLVYGVVRKANGIPKWTDGVAEKAKTRADNIWGKGLPLVACVTHPRVPRSEPTSEQASATPSSDVIDLVSDDEEILLVEDSEDRNQNADHRDVSVSEGSRIAPIDYKQDVSHMNHIVRQSTASDMFFDIPGARAQLKNGKCLSDEDVIDLILHLRRFSV